MRYSARVLVWLGGSNATAALKQAGLSDLPLARAMTEVAAYAATHDIGGWPGTRKSGAENGGVQHQRQAGATTLHKIQLVTPRDPHHHATQAPGSVHSGVPQRQYGRPTRAEWPRRHARSLFVFRDYRGQALEVRMLSSCPRCVTAPHDEGG